MVAALYDIHGNLPALEVVLAEVDDADAIVVGGDVVVGPYPAETLDRLMGLGDRVLWIRGNADRELATPGEGKAPAHLLEWVLSRLTGAQVEFLVGLPERLSLDIDGLGTALFVHATPRNDTEILTDATPEPAFAEAFAATADLVVCGHTHMQFDRTAGGTRVVNAGSVGMPYEHEPGAYWAVLGPEVAFRRTPYEARPVVDSGWPDEWPEASREEATAFFESLAGR